MGSKIMTGFWLLIFPFNVWYQEATSCSCLVELTKNISMATCFPLSWKLLIYALDTLFVASDKTPVKLLLNESPIDTVNPRTS